MRKFFSFLLVLSFSIVQLGIFFPPAKVAASEDASWSVPLEVNNVLSIDRVQEPVTNGFPLPADLEIKDVASLRLMDSKQHVIPAQFSVMARWGGSPTDTSLPIKWALVTFFADVGAKATQTYTVVRSQEEPVLPFELIVNESQKNQLSISTGVAEFLLDITSPMLLKAVTMGTTRIAPGSSNAFSLTDLTGKQIKGMPEHMWIAEQGPLRTVVKTEGTFLSDTGNTLLDYRLSLTFYAGKSFVHVLTTVGNHGKAALNGTSYDVFAYGGKNSVSFSDLRFVTSLADPQGSLTYVLPTQEGLKQGTIGSTLSVYQDSSGTDYWNRYTSADNPRPNSYSRFRGYQVTQDSVLQAQGDHFEGWFSLADTQKSVTVFMKDFWQNFPKAFDVDKTGNLGIALFPDAYAGNYNFRVGEEKTQEFILHFTASKESVQDLSNRAQTLLDPLWALPSHEALTHSGALAEFSPEQGSVEERFGQVNTTDSFKRYAYYNDRTLLEDPQYKGSHYRAFHSLWESSTSSPSSTDYFNDYGWAAYGNQPLEEETYGEGKAGYFDLKYDFDWGAWMQFLRTGDTRWKDMAQAASHYQEQLMLHDVVTETGWDVARWKNAVFGHAQHNEPGNINGARNYLGPVMDTAWGARGATLHYYLTGYEPSRKFAEDFANYAYDFYKDRRESPYLWNGYERYAANLLSVLVEGSQLTGEKKYQELAHDLLVYYAPEKQPYIHGPISNNTNDFVRPWMLATYLSAVGRYANTMSATGNTSEAQFAQSHLMGYVDWIKKYGMVESGGWLTTNYSYYVNNDIRNQDKGNMLINNWTLTLADVFAYAYAFKADQKDLEIATSFFRTGTSNPYFENSPLIYSSSKEAVNHMVFGQVYLSQVKQSNQQETSQEETPTSIPDTSSEETTEQTTEQPVPVPTKPSSQTGSITVSLLPSKDAWIQVGQQNYGAASKLIIYNSMSPSYRSLFQFDFSQIPQNAQITKATFSLSGKNLYGTNNNHFLFEMMTGWNEGKGTYGNTKDGATWTTKDGVNAWQNVGGDLSSAPIIQFTLSGMEEQKVTLDISSIVQSWVSGQKQNNGLALSLSSSVFYAGSEFYSKEATDESKRPQVIVEYELP